MENLEGRFHEEMLRLYREANEQCSYNSVRFLQMVSEQGGVQAAKALLHATGYSDGFTTLWEHGRLDLSMEARVIQDPWRALFTADELAVARRRLKELGHSAPSEPIAPATPVDLIVTFEDDDPGYRAWLSANPSGYVVNSTKSGGGVYLKLHGASCGTISGEPASGTTWTRGQYRKICSARRGPLDDWARREYGEELDPCGFCFR